jgi:hypothetical protein
MINLTGQKDGMEPIQTGMVNYLLEKEIEVLRQTTLN